MYRHLISMKLRNILKQTLCFSKKNKIGNGNKFSISFHIVIHLLWFYVLNVVLTFHYNVL